VLGERQGVRDSLAEAHMLFPERSIWTMLHGVGPAGAAMLLRLTTLVGSFPAERDGNLCRARAGIR